MSSSSSYITEIESISKELKRLNAHVKLLREQKKLAEKYLYEYMVNHNIKSVGPYTRKKLMPKKISRKKLKEKKQDGIRLFQEVGIPDPVSFWDEFQKTQKVPLPENDDYE